MFVAGQERIDGSEDSHKKANAFERLPRNVDISLGPGKPPPARKLGQFPIPNSAACS